MLELRPWRLAPPATSEAERPIWQTLGILYAMIAFLVILLIGISFLAAHLVTGRAY
jgi:heme/copper-type cytochrome/quinol oxidase subunit 2